MTYGPAMAGGYERGRHLRTEDVGKWMSAARAYLPGASGRVLDLGAGTGRFSNALARTCGAVVVGCEPSSAMRAVCRLNCPGILVVGGAAEAMPFRADAFDAVWASQVLHHVRNLPAFAANLRRVLRPAGHLLIRGGFGAVEDLPLHRYFPLAWAAGKAVRLSLEHIAGVLATAGIVQVGHHQVDQVYAETSDELIDKVRSRSLSHLAELPEAAFREGMIALERDAAKGDIPEPVVDRLDLVVFRPAG